MARLLSAGAGVMIGQSIEWNGAELPSSNFMWEDGAAISRTAFAVLFKKIGTTFGAGDGATTFNLPNRKGRVGFGRDDMGGTAANRITTAGAGFDGKTLGAGGGSETVTLSSSQMPSHSHSYSDYAKGGSGGDVFSNGQGSTAIGPVGRTSGGAGSGGAHRNVPPGIVKNFCIRVK